MKNRLLVRGVLLLFLPCFAIIEAAGAQWPAELKLLTVNGATGVRRHDLHQIKATELSYTVTLEYPNMAITQPHFKELEKGGWKECTGTRTGWDSHADSVDKKHPYCAFELGKYFINRNNLMLISLRYRTKVGEKFTCAASPDNSNQLVIVVIYEHENRESMQLDRLGLSCAK